MNRIRLQTKAVTICRYLYRFNSHYTCLHVSGNPEQNQNAILKPYIDFKSILDESNRSEFEQNLKLRRVCEQFPSFDQLQELYRVFEQLSETKKNLESNKELLNEKLKLNFEDEKYRLQMRILKSDLKTLKKPYWDIEENMYENFLKLPNTLHEFTPKFEDLKIYSNGNSNNNNIPLSSTISQMQNDKLFYEHDVAISELELQYEIEKRLLKYGFIQFNNADFCRRIVLEGAQMIDECLPIENSKSSNTNFMYLCGNGSILSFLAYFTKHFVHKSVMPVQLFSMGKVFLACEPNEFRQQSVVSVFLITNTVNVSDHFFTILNQFIDIYEHFGFSFQIILRSAPNLKFNETLRVSFEMFSNSHKKFFEIGSISIYDSFFSKRLLITTNSDDSQFPNIISGQLISIQKLFHCIPEIEFKNKIFI